MYITSAILLIGLNTLISLVICLTALCLSKYGATGLWGMYCFGSFICFLIATTGSIAEVKAEEEQSVEKE